MAEDEVTEISETDSQKADSDCWDIIKRKLDESGLKYTEKPEKGHLSLNTMEMMYLGMLFSMYGQEKDSIIVSAF